MELTLKQLENLKAGQREYYLISTKDEQANEAEKSIIHLISTDDVDRGFDIMDPKGVDWTDFEKTKSVFFNHDYDKVIGRNAWLKIVEHGVLAKTIFSDTDIGKDKFLLHKEGSINSWSIGFEIRKGADGFRLPEAVEWADDKSMLRKILLWNLYEYSSTGIPMNPNAIDIAKSVCKSSFMKSEISRVEGEMKLQEVIDGFKAENESLKKKIEESVTKTDYLELKSELEKLTEKINKEIPNANNITPEAFKEMLSASLKKHSKNLII